MNQTIQMLMLSTKSLISHMHTILCAHVTIIDCEVGLITSEFVINCKLAQTFMPLLPRESYCTRLTQMIMKNCYLNKCTAALDFSFDSLP